MDFNKEDTSLKTLDEDYDMVPINTYIRAINNYRMFQGIQGQYPNNYFMPQFRQNYMNDSTIKPMTYYKVDHNLPNSESDDNYDFRNVDLKDNFGMRMMEEDDLYSIDKTRDLDYDDFVDVNKILMKIERYNPGIFQFLRRYG
ncbi:hypothetical protein Z962_07410, partial [Clostridium botulinum C/D str. BKT12695]